MTVIHTPFGFDHPISDICSLKKESKDKIIFTAIHAVDEHPLTYTFSRDRISDDEYIQIEDQVYKYEEILENPDRIFALIKEDALKESIDQLP